MGWDCAEYKFGKQDCKLECTCSKIESKNNMYVG